MVREAGGSRAAVGYDGRLSSPELEAAVVEGLRDGGLDVLRVGLGPTPMLYFAVRSLGLDGGVMVTGSHNPAEYNGFKMMLGKGAFYGAAIRAYRRNRRAGAMPAARAARSRIARMLDAYVDRLAPGLSRRPAADGGLGRRQRRGGRSHGAAGRAHPGPPSAALPDDRRPLPQSPSRSRRCPRTWSICRPRSPRKRPISASPSTAMATASAWSTAAAILWGDQLMVLFAREVLAEQPGRHRDRRRQGKPGAVRRDRSGRRQAPDVAHRPFADQGQDGRDRRAAGRRDERAYLLRRSLLRL